MKLKYLIIIALLGLLVRGYAILPDFYGARSLALGFGTVGFEYTSNAIFINPALLGDFPGSITSYQYQNSARSWGNFFTTMRDLQARNLKNFSGFSAEDKSDVVLALKDIYNMKNGLYGFESHLPGFLLGNYAFSVSVFNTGLMNPADTSVLDKSPESITQQDIESLKFNFINLKYTSYTAAYSLELSTGLRLGLSLHYLSGEVSYFSETFLNKSFPDSTNIRTYLDYGHDKPSYVLGRLNMDLGLSLELGKYFKIGLVSRNFNSPVIFKTDDRELVLERRIIAGLAFRPGKDWGIYFDLDIFKTDLYFSGKEVQPVSLGAEKGFFQNRLVIRLGFRNDLSMTHFVGEKSNMIYGFGLGFNTGKLIIDLGGALDSSGSMACLAISGFLIIK